ncbi:MAG: hypothetical protein HKM02_12050 [Pseudomonadales bacterium]|nr:hypothetical protein [Pseudomonadales bacterium]
MAYVMASNLLLYLMLQAAAKWPHLSLPRVLYGASLPIVLTLVMVVLNLTAYPASVYTRGLTAEQVAGFSHLALAGFMLQCAVFVFFRVQRLRLEGLSSSNTSMVATHPIKSKTNHSGGAKKRRRRQRPRA